MNRSQAEQFLQTAVGNSRARFRKGQWEAINALVNHRQKLLVVQRTGWGKSSVYFISTRILRDRGAGPTVIVSPLLALMRNQIEAAGRLGIRAETINSANEDDWNEIKQKIRSDVVDTILISPERLANDEFVNTTLMPIADRIGLLVVDEVHCISDWGHDFRPDYRRLLNVLRQLPSNMPVLGTTATANDRVIWDVRHQLGEIEIQRGSLVRDSLSLQTLRLDDQAARLAWLAKNVPKLPGTGIIYVLTIRDAKQVAAWLTSQGIAARAYFNNVEHDEFSDSNAYREHLEKQLLHNKLKALVATTALGMGYDKPDLGFVIHYQAPGSVVSYYQQVGRAGRAIDSAVGILLSGREDEDIHEYFRRTAFPPENDVKTILNALEGNDGMSMDSLQQHLNLRYGQIDKVLKLLGVENPAPVVKLGSEWRRTPVHSEMDRDRIDHLTRQREREWRQIQEYIDTEDCLMSFLRRALDDQESSDCGRCANCLGQPIIDPSIEHGLRVQATRFLQKSEFPFVPRKQVAAGVFPEYGFSGNLSPGHQAREGRVLSRWGDSGWGYMVAEDKHDGHFRDALVEAVAEMFEQRWRPDPPPQWVTCVPSLNHSTLVPNFASRLADRLRLPFCKAIRKTRANEPQKDQQNQFHQCRNLDGVFAITADVCKKPVLLVDDVIDSRWTVTVLAALLQDRGSGPVYPVALASSSIGG